MAQDRHNQYCIQLIQPVVLHIDVSAFVDRKSKALSREVLSDYIFVKLFHMENRDVRTITKSCMEDVVISAMPWQIHRQIAWQIGGKSISFLFTCPCGKLRANRDRCNFFNLPTRSPVPGNRGTGPSWTWSICVRYHCSFLQIWSLASRQSISDHFFKLFLSAIGLNSTIFGW